MDLGATPAPPRKFKTIEKRREKSRHAARFRREKEGAIYSGLYELVPIVDEPTVTHVDRIAALRLAAAFCRTRLLSRKVVPYNSRHVVTGDICNVDAEFASCTDEFLLLVDNHGTIVFVSQSVSTSLGLTQTDLIGHNLYEYLHNGDQAALKELLYVPSAEEDGELDDGEKPEKPPTIAQDEGVDEIKETLLRVKSVLTARGRNLNLRSAIYKVVSFIVSRLPILENQPDEPMPELGAESCGTDALEESKLLELQLEAGGAGGGGDDESDGGSERGGSPEPPPGPKSAGYFLMYGNPIPFPTSVDKSLEPNWFMTRHSTDMKFSYCNERVADTLGYDVKALVGMSLYSLIHIDDLEKVSKAINSLKTTSQTAIGMYRILVCGGGYIWMYSEASQVSHNTRGHRGQYIVCIHQIVSSERVPEKVEIIFATNQTAEGIAAREQLQSDMSNLAAAVLSKQQLEGNAPAPLRSSHYCPDTPYYSPSKDHCFRTAPVSLKRSQRDHEINTAPAKVARRNTTASCSSDVDEIENLPCNPQDSSLDPFIKILEQLSDDELIALADTVCNDDYFDPFEHAKSENDLEFLAPFVPNNEVLTLNVIMDPAISPSSRKSHNDSRKFNSWVARIIRGTRGNFDKATGDNCAALMSPGQCASILQCKPAPTISALESTNEFAKDVLIPALPPLLSSSTEVRALSPRENTTAASPPSALRQTCVTSIAQQMYVPRRGRPPKDPLKRLLQQQQRSATMAKQRPTPHHVSQQIHHQRQQQPTVVKNIGLSAPLPPATALLSPRQAVEAGDSDSSSQNWHAMRQQYFDINEAAAGLMRLSNNKPEFSPSSSIGGATGIYNNQSNPSILPLQIPREGAISQHQQHVQHQQHMPARLPLFKSVMESSSPHPRSGISNYNNLPPVPNPLFMRRGTYPGGGVPMVPSMSAQGGSVFGGRDPNNPGVQQNVMHQHQRPQFIRESTAAAILQQQQHESRSIMANSSQPATISNNSNFPLRSGLKLPIMCPSPSATSSVLNLQPPSVQVQQGNVNPCDNTGIGPGLGTQQHSPRVLQHHSPVAQGHIGNTPPSSIYPPWRASGDSI